MREEPSLRNRNLARLLYKQESKVYTLTILRRDGQQFRFKTEYTNPFRPSDVGSRVLELLEKTSNPAIGFTITTNR